MAKKRNNRSIIVTVLGSCVSACIRDPIRGIGGMNHFMLPAGQRDDADRWQHGCLDAAARYGNYAMELLINTILKHGGNRAHLEVKIVGGGRILTHMTDIGQRNITFVRDYLRTEGLQVIAEDVGDIHPRKVYYLPSLGKVRMQKLRALHNDTILRLQVDDNPEPIKELRRLVDAWNERRPRAVTPACKSTDH